MTLAAPAGSIFVGPGGRTFHLADWISDPVYSTVTVTVAPRASSYPKRTGCWRRWPDAAIGRLDATLVDRLTLVDADLRDLVARTIDAWEANDSVENEWVLAHTIDAAVDEQDRRRGWAPRAPRPPEPAPEPMVWETLTYGVGVNFQRLPRLHRPRFPKLRAALARQLLL